MGKKSAFFFIFILDRLDVQRIEKNPPPGVAGCSLVGYTVCMDLLLAFVALPAGSPRQRARCAKTGRFVAWSKAAPLRRAAPGEVVHVPLPALPACAEEEAPSVGGVVLSAAAAVVAGVRRVAAAVGRWFRRAARLAGAVALATALASDADRTLGAPGQAPGRGDLVGGLPSARGGAP